MFLTTANDDSISDSWLFPNSFLCVFKGVLNSICCFYCGIRAIGEHQYMIFQYFSRELWFVAMLITKWEGTAPTPPRQFVPALVIITTSTGHIEVVYNFGDSALYFEGGLKAFQMYPHSSGFLYVPSWLFWEILYSQEILLQLYNTWTSRFYIKYSFHVYILKKAGVHVLLWNWNNKENIYATNTIRC